MRLRAVIPAIVAALFFSTPALPAQTTPRITQPVDRTQLRILRNHLPTWANSSNHIGLVPPDQVLDQLTMVLQRSPEQELAFQTLLADQQNPTSPNYHHWLTPNEVGERFGLSDQDIETLSGWLRSQGLHINWVSPSRIFIAFGGTAADVGKAFQAEFNSYRVNGEERISVASDPMVPAALFPAIKAIHGLYTIENRPALHMGAAESNSPAFNSNSGSHYIMPADFAAIYDLPVGLTGAGQTIGIVDRARTDFADFDNFRSLTGSTFPNPTEIVPTAFGGVDPGPAATSCTATPCAPPAGQSESTLDVLRAGSVAPGAKLLLVVDTTASGDIETDAQYLVQTSPVPVQIMSISYSKCESSSGPSRVAFWDTLFQQAAGEGISVFVSSDDSGASGCDTHGDAPPPTSPSAISPNYICSSSYATCVGGTEFNDLSNAYAYWNFSNGVEGVSALGYIPEGAWNEPLDSAGSPEVDASGGGVSSIIATPSWQTGTGVPAAKAGRYTPDISLSAASHDGYFACFAAAGSSCVTGSSGTYSFEYFYGTSAAAPSMAGIAALLNQNKGGAQGNLNPQLYQLAARVPGAFHDVTAASSGVTGCSINIPSMCNNSLPSAYSLTGGQTGYMVTTGYDEVTGLGSLDAQAFIDNYLSANQTSPTVTVSGTPVTFTHGATSGNVSTVTVTPANGFTGSVTLSAVVTSSPSGAAYPPTLSFGSTSPVVISGTAGVTANLTITTTATSSALTYPMNRRLPWQGPGVVLAGLLLFGIPRYRGRFKVLGMSGILFLLAGGMLACGGGSGGGGSTGGGGNSIPGTTAGTYVVTVTCSSGSTTLSSGTLTVHVQ